MFANECCFLDMRAFIIMLVPQAMCAQSKLFNLIQIHFLHFVTLVVEVVSLADFAHLFFHMLCGRSSCVCVYVRLLRTDMQVLILDKMDSCKNGLKMGLIEDLQLTVLLLYIFICHRRELMVEMTLN